MTRARVTAINTVLLATGAALAQTNGFFFKVSNDISPQQPSATVELWAYFDPAMYALYDVALDMAATPDSGAFSDPVVDEKVGYCSFTNPGVMSPDGDFVSGITVFQFQCGGGCFAAKDNPFYILSYTWSTDDFHGRQVNLSTVTSKFMLFQEDFCSTGDFLHDDFAEGTGQITIVPAPGGLTALAIAGVMSARGRRR